MLPDVRWLVTGLLVMGLMVAGGLGLAGALRNAHDNAASPFPIAQGERAAWQSTASAAQPTSLPSDTPPLMPTRAPDEQALISGGQTVAVERPEPAPSTPLEDQDVTGSLAPMPQAAESAAAQEPARLPQAERSDAPAVNGPVATRAADGDAKALEPGEVPRGVGDMPAPAPEEGEPPVQEIEQVTAPRSPSPADKGQQRPIDETEWIPIVPSAGELMREQEAAERNGAPQESHPATASNSVAAVSAEPAPAPVTAILPPTRPSEMPAPADAGQAAAIAKRRMRLNRLRRLRSLQAEKP